jgi:hypothetical protein
MEIIGNLDQDEIRIKFKIANLVYWIEDQDNFRKVESEASETV